MISDLDAFRAARLFLEQHGEGAAALAALRAETMIEAGDAVGAIVWRAILGAIEVLQRERRDGEALN